jgi:diadenylate cyclase
MDLLSAIDILLVASIFYLLLRIIRGTRAVQLLRGIIILVILSFLLTNVLKLRAFSFLIRNLIPALLVAIPVIFQPEIRRALERLGRAWLLRQEATSGLVSEQISRTCARLSELRHGALIVIEGETGLEEYMDTGVRVGGTVSMELLLTIFSPGTVLHDGAVIVRGDKVLAAACILPISDEIAIDPSLGLRHRAAVGITEESDAISIVVSEETGIISLAEDGILIRHLDEKRLKERLLSFYKPQPSRAFQRFLKGERR